MPVEPVAPLVAAPPPAPTAPRSTGYGSRRVPAALVLVLAPVLAVVTFAGGAFVERAGVLGGPAIEQPSGAPAGAGSSDELALIEQAWTTIHGNYVDPKGLDDEAMAHAAIRGMTEAVGDEGHTEFMTADEAKAIDQSLSGQFVGIGVQVAEGDEGGITISNVFPNTPAEEAGLQRGDHIVAVDGKTTEGETLDQTVVPGPRARGRGGDADHRPRRQGRLRRHDHAPRVRPAARELGDGARARRSR